ncbi:MAG: ATP-binding protein [Thermoleophilaceae bacterium]|nr:ATP-binding protein [Thermoleophilaceae bacterium]
MTRSGTRSGADETLSLQLEGNNDAAATARAALGRLRADIDPPLMETLRLLITELVTNSVKHASSERVSLRVFVRPRSVRTEVVDGGPGFDPETTGVPRADRGGWGLFLVERLADSWGAGHEAGSTKVWFELRRV